MCACVSFFKQSKDFSACNSLFITVILPQVCSASIVIGLLFSGGGGLGQERTKWQKGELKKRRPPYNGANEQSRHSTNSISSRLSSLSIRPWGDFIDYRSPFLTHLHIPSTLLDKLPADVFCMFPSIEFTQTITLCPSHSLTPRTPPCLDVLVLVHHYVVSLVHACICQKGPLC